MLPSVLSPNADATFKQPVRSNAFFLYPPRADELTHHEKSVSVS